MIHVLIVLSLTLVVYLVAIVIPERRCTSKNFFLIFFQNFGSYLIRLLVISMLYVVVLLITSFIIEIVLEPVYKCTSTEKIYAIEDNHATGIYMSRSQYREKIMISYVVKDQFGYSMKNVEAGISYINYLEDPADEPHVDTYTPFYAYSWMNGFFPNGYFEYYSFYVPEGSISDKYNLDIKT